MIGVVFDLLWGLLSLASLFFFLRWSSASAAAWLSAVRTQRELNRTYGLGLAITGGLLTIWLGARPVGGCPLRLSDDAGHRRADRAGRLHQPLFVWIGSGL